MISSSERELITAIHDAPVKACLVITGAGASAIAALFSLAGASRTIIDAQIPYARAALDRYVGSRAEQHVSASEAADMAIVAYQLAIDLSDRDYQRGLVGLSCTAAIATDRMRRGENRAHIAWHDGERTTTYSIVMHKGERDRSGEEAVCRAIILNALGEACNVAPRVPIDLLEGESVDRDYD